MPAAALLALSGCATPFKADVARFQAMPAPQGQSFTIRPADPRNEGGLEFGQYADLVAQQLVSQGYVPAREGANATLTVTLDYGVDNGQQKVVTRPGFGAGYGGWGRPYGRWGYRSSFYYGWNDPFWYDPWAYPDVSSYTFYTSYLDMTISGQNGQRLFEGKAKARSTTDSLPTLVPNLVQAMFTNFPGRSGEEVRITIPPPKKD
ncbi:hypothetical protein G432_15345 [Sphingomonas sp. MM-1]|nr:hypothetical protein G432_15345 [Sphingomonas sp. MM-1]